MSRLYSVFYNKLSKRVTGTKVELFSELVLLAASGYLILKKAYGLSISDWLLTHALQPTAVNAYIYASGATLVLAIIVKGLALMFQRFPAVSHAQVEPEHIAECLQVMNSEISQHIKRCDERDPPDVKKLGDQHQFDVNIRLIVEALAEHIRKTSRNKKLKKKDLFISLYTFGGNALRYELHYDPRRDMVNSKVISLSDQEYEGYECVKCMASTNSTAYVLDKRYYRSGSSKRYKTVKQYMGCKLENLDTVFGFLNIELHNHELFVDEDQMQDFMEEHVFPFKLLLEYQYLKRAFFERFAEFEKYWGGV